MSLAHLHMTYAAAAGSGTNPRLFFNQFQSQYTTPPTYYPTYQPQSIPQPNQYNQQRSNFAIQEILGLNSQPNNTAQNFNPFFSLNIPSLSPTETQTSTSNNSSVNSMGSPSKTSESTTVQNSSDSSEESNFLNRANEAAAYAAAYGAYFSRTNFMSNFQNLEQNVNKIPQNTSLSINSEDENLNDSLGKLTLCLIYQKFYFVLILKR